jgi:uncharacterized protein
MTVHPFVVNVARLRRLPGSRASVSCQGPVDPAGELDPSSPAESTVPAGADAVCDVTLESFVGGVSVSGTVRAPWTGMCRRCTAPVGGELHIAVRERFVEAPVPAEDELAYPMVDDQIDLGVMVHEAVVLELPLAPLCDLACRGLCPQCGADRNHESCSCVAPRDPRWANLDVLRSSS